MFKVRQLKWRRWSIQSSFARDYKKLKEEKAPRERFHELDAEEYFTVREVDRDIDREVGLRLCSEARFLDVEIPPCSDEQMWVRSDDGERVWLTSKGRAQVRRLIDEEKARRFKVKTQWVTNLVLPLLGLIIGVIGAVTGLIAILHQKK